MMWDLGGQAYVPGSSSAPPPRPPSYQHQQSTYPAYPQEPMPFAPLAQPSPQIGYPGYENAYAAAYPDPYQGNTRMMSEPANAFAGAVQPRAVEYSYSGHSAHSHHSQHHTLARPHRLSNAQPPHRVSHEYQSAVASTRPHASSSASAHAHTSSHAPQVHAQAQQHVFQYSKCTGRKKALCIGINYFGTPQELHGCINDARNVRQFLINRCGYKAEDIVLLSDDSSNPRKKPTRVNMLDAMKWLVRGAHKHDSLFFHYSGHGSQVKDRDGDERDGFDEVILPVDYKSAGYVSDDLMHEYMVKPLPLGCRLTALFDSCHSGSVLDLPYLYHTNGRVKGSQVTKRFEAAKATPADVISWAGCKDSQTSADTYEAGVATGAMSHAFIQSLRDQPHQTYQELLRAVRKILHDKYSQKPQLSSSHHIDTSLEFIL